MALGCVVISGCPVSTTLYSRITSPTVAGSVRVSVVAMVS
jgi:hypothetical protein